MRCPTLAELPPPPPGKTGWPWTEDCPQLPDAMPDGRPWPRISIVTPSFNQGGFIEETIRSILLQGYPDLEYIVMDGAVDVIRHYAPWLAHWRSEPDRGQAHAINKGFYVSTGKIFQFINSDDLVAKNAYACVANRIGDYIGIAGGFLNFDSEKTRLYFNNNINVSNLILHHEHFHQPGIWTTRDAFNIVGSFDESLTYAFDKKWLIMLLDKAPNALTYVNDVFVHFCLHDESKTMSQNPGFVRDTDAIAVKLRTSLSRQNAKFCRLRLRREHWKQELESIRNSQEPYALRLAQILVGMVRDPVIRISRPTLGAIRRLNWERSA